MGAAPVLELLVPQLSQTAIKELLGLIAERRAACAKDGKTSAGLESVQTAFESLMAKGQGSNLFWVKPEAQETVSAPCVPILKHSSRIGSAEEGPCHVLLEGDNLHALQILGSTHAQGVDVIYIDPPYNTGKGDFRYNDVWVDGENQWRHSLWLSFMTKRLQLARRLLKEEGLVFISIDDNEQHNLRNLCDEVFGAANRIQELVWDLGTGTQAGHFVRSHEYVLVYAKQKAKCPLFPYVGDDTISHGALKKISKANPASEIEFPAGMEFEGTDAEFPSEIGGSEKQFVTKGQLTFKDGRLVGSVTIKAGWAMKRQILTWLSGAETWDSKGQRVTKFYFNKSGILCYEKMRGTVHPKTVLSDYGSTKTGSNELTALIGDNSFSFPKPTNLLKALIGWATTNNDSAVVLDFFGGSGTTLDAVVQLNGVSGSRQCILVTNNEVDAETQGELRKRGVEQGSKAWEARGICASVTVPRIDAVCRRSLENGRAIRVEHFRVETEPLRLTSHEAGEHAYSVSDKAEARATLIRAAQHDFSRFVPIAWLEAGACGAYSASHAETGHGTGFAVVRKASELPRSPSVPLRVVYLLTDALVEQPGSSLSAAAARVASKFPATQKVKVKELWIDYMKNFPVEEK